MAGNALMRAMRLLMLIPFLGAIAYGLVMTKFTQEMQSGEPGFATDLVTRVGAAWINYTVTARRDAVMDTTRLNDERLVMLRHTVDLRDLPGGAAGLAGPRAELAALAAAKTLGEAECANMIEGFATACGFSSAEVRIDDTEARAELDVSLSFTPSAPGGTPKAAEGQGLVPQRVLLTDAAGIVVPLASLPAERARIYAATEDACTALRTEKGSCVIMDIMLDERPTGEDTATLTASAEIAHLGARASASEILDHTSRDTPEAGLMAAALQIAMEAQRTMMSSGEAPQGASLDDPAPAPPVSSKTLLDSSKSLLDGMDLPRFKDSQGGAKFVTAP